MEWIDGHLDLAYLAMSGRDLTKPADGESGCIALPDLREANVAIVLATIFIDPDPERADHPAAYAGPDDVDGAERAGFAQVEVYEALEARGEVSIVRNRDDLLSESALPKLVLLMEGADPIRSPTHVAEWVARGVRIVGLTWAQGTRYAGGNAKHGPLTDAGRELVAALDEHGVVHDASHLADDALDELFECASGPIIATHSNCRSLVSPKQRHLRDEDIVRIAERGGVIGINLYSNFLVAEGRASVHDVVRHIEHIERLTGDRSAIGLGSDADGGFLPRDMPEGLDHPRKYDAIANALRERGWSEADIAGFRFRNWRRRLEAWLPETSERQIVKTSK